MQDRGTRADAYRQYLQPALGRENLQVNREAGSGGRWEGVQEGAC